MPSNPLDPTIIPCDPNWISVISHGDIVRFAFPTNSQAEEPKLRPCLVMDITRKRSQRYAVLAYGTSSRCRFFRGLEITVSDPYQVRLSGLLKATRFIGARRLEVRLTDPRFIVNGLTHTPVLGRVDDETLVRVDSLRTKLRQDAFEERQARRTLRDAGNGSA